MVLLIIMNDDIYMFIFLFLDLIYVIYYVMKFVLIVYND